MNLITRLILHRVASGNVRLTPQVIEVLKEVSEDRAENPSPAPREPADSADESDPEMPSRDARLGFLSPTGRWFYQMSCALLLIAGTVVTTFAADSFDAANEAFARGKYAEAARGYDTVIAQHGYSVPVLFNLANAQQRDGKPGHAILNYERAALLAPNDPDITANLNSARQKAGLVTEKPSAIQNAARVLTLNAWFELAAAAVFLIVMALPLKHLRPQARGVLNFGGGLAACALVVAVGALVVRGGDFQRAVVTAPEAVAGVSPVTMAQSVFKLRAGEVVTLQQTHGDFALIRSQSGHEGWVKAGEIARIIPSPAKFPRS